MIRIVRLTKIYATPEDGKELSVNPLSVKRSPEEVSFRELVDIMRCGAWFVSCQPATGSVFEFLHQYIGRDHRTGNGHWNSLHYDTQQARRRDKYWRLAMKAAGMIT